MKQHYTDEKQISATRCRAIIIFLTLFYPPKRKKPLAFGDNGTCGISSRIAKSFTRIY